MSLDQALDMVNKGGVPVGLIIVIVIAIGRFAKWAAPRCEESLRRHFSFMDGLQSIQVKQAENQVRVAELLERIGTRLDDSERARVDSESRHLEMLQRVTESVATLEIEAKVRRKPNAKSR